MQTAPIMVVIIAFLGGAFLTSINAGSVDWPPFMIMIMVGAIGVFLYKRNEALAAKDDTLLKANRAGLEESLSNILKNLADLDGRKDKVPTYEMRFEIDKLFRDDLSRFAEARESMKHIFGLREYADIMSSFAAGERYINRVWSSSTDGYVDEVLMYVSKAHSQFQHAKEEFDKAVAATA